MIWIDSSFAVEWLLGTERASKVSLGKELSALLPMQYAETLAYFLKKGGDPLEVVGELEGIELKNPDKIYLQQAVPLYLAARDRHSKASLADAVLASVAIGRGEKVASFDGDFEYLGMKNRGGLWSQI